MNIFATKDGKIYKVSMKNFVDATGKKAPYYKRTEKKGKVYENGYALCPGCGNPIHFVNLFNKGHKKKKKKAHARHQRSSIKGLATYNAAAYGCCPFGSKKLKLSDNSSHANVPLSSSISAISSAFGLSLENSELLSKIYFLLKNEDSANAEHNFFALIATSMYNSPYPDNESEDFSTTQYAKGLFWNSIADIKNNKLESEHLLSLGITNAEINDLIKGLEDQHNLLEDTSQTYYRKPDLAHLCATTATILTNKIEKPLGALVAGSQNEIYSADATAGYIGDLCGVGDHQPSMNDGDYKADLDAVNIAALIQSSPNTSLLEILENYYSGIESGKINRAEEFKKNVGLDMLKSQRDAYKDRLQHSVLGQMSLKERLSLFDKFISYIEQGAEEWPNDQ